MKSTMRLWTCFGAMACVAVAVNLPPIYLTTFSETFGGRAGLSAEEMGRIPAILFAGLVLGIVLGGPLADRWGGKVFAMLGLALVAAGLVAMGLAQNYEAVLAAAALLGLGAGTLDMVLSPIVCALEPGRRIVAMNWLHSFYSTGAVATVVVGAGGLATSVPWRAVALLAAGFPALVFAGFARMKVPGLVEENRSRAPVGALLRLPFFVGLIAALFFAGASEAGMSQWLPAFAERALGCAKWTSSLALAGFLAAMSAGRIGVALAGERTRPLAVLAASATGCLVLYLVGSFCPVRWIALGASIAVGLSVSAMWPTLVGVAANRFPGGASMFATLAAFGNSGCFVMPWVIGVVAGRSGLHWGVGSSAVAPLMLLAVIAWIARQSRTAKAL